MAGTKSMAGAKSKPDPALLASELRVVLGQVVRRLRAENRFPLSHALVLGRLDREGAQSVSDLAAAERVRPQSMAQTVTDLQTAGLVSRTPDPDDGRRVIVDLTADGHAALVDERRNRDGWLASAIVTEMSIEEQSLLVEAVELLRRLAES